MLFVVCVVVYYHCVLFVVFCFRLLLLSIDRWLLLVVCSSLHFCCALFVVCRSLSCFSLFVLRGLLLVACCALFVVCVRCVLFVVRCVLFVVYCSLLVVC